jgi:hypothetical protein
MVETTLVFSTHFAPAFAPKKVPGKAVAMVVAARIPNPIRPTTPTN